VAAIKYDVTDVPEGGGGNQPQPSLYKGKIVSVVNRKKNARGEACNDLEVVVDVGEEFARLWTYIQLDNPASKWKLREFTDAMGLPPKGAIDPVKLKNKPVTVKVSADTDLDGNYRGRVKNLFKPGTVEEDDDADADGEATEAEGEELTRDELEGWELSDLKEEAEAREITVEGRASKAKYINAIMEQIEGDAPEEAEEEAEEETDGNGSGVLSEISEELLEDLKPDEDYYEDWSDEDIKQFVEDLGIAGNISGRKSRAKYIAAITELASQSENGDGAEGGVEDDYDEWSLQELKDEVATRKEAGSEFKISGRQTEEKLIAALREDDKAAEPF
jgi:hypothetical protein